jgi:hypothetical protein
METVETLLAYCQGRSFLKTASQLAVASSGATLVQWVALYFVK